MKKEKRLIPLKTLKKYYSFLRGCNTRRFRFGQRSEQTECPICFEKFNETSEMNVCTNICTHTFHCECIQEWINTTNGTGTCPICRSDIDIVTPTRELPVIVPQRPNRSLLSAFNEVADTPPRSRYSPLNLVRSSPPRIRRSNAISPQELEQFNNTGSIGAQAMEYPSYDPFDSPPRVRNGSPSIPPGAPRRGPRPPRR